MQLSSLAIQFVLEGRDHCDSAARGLLYLEKNSHDPEIINGIHMYLSMQFLLWQ